ncbi:MAG: protein tlpB [Bacteroidota bacterium]|nr:protein tlpB [Bacteroidota bacterium]
MPKSKVILSVILSLLCGALFVISAYTKLFPIEPLEISLVDIGFSWKLAPYLARTLIGLEFGLGFLFVFLFKLRKITVPVSIALLFAFIVYLLLLMKQYGNRGSCGCFGETIPMTPVEGIIKNIVLIVLLTVLYFISPGFDFRFKKIIAALGVVVLLVLPFILNPTASPFKPKTLEAYEKKEIDLNSLYKGDDSTGIPPGVDLRKGKHIIAFLSMRCPHCRIAAKKLVVIEKEHPDIPLFFILAGRKDRLKDFFDDTKCDSIPYMHLKNDQMFLQFTHGAFPQIFWVNNSQIEFDCNYFELNDIDIEKWLQVKRP